MQVLCLPDAGTSLGLFHAPAQPCHTHGAPARYSSRLLPHFCAPALGETSPRRSIFLTEAVRRGCRAPGPRTKGRSPNRRSRHSLCVATRPILVELCGVSRVSAQLRKGCVTATGSNGEKTCYPNFAKANIAAFCSKILHPIECQLAKVSRVF